jgi:MFS family permease
MVDTTLAMNEGINPKRLFVLSCIALLVTSLTFGIRAGMMDSLGQGFSLSNKQLGWMTFMAFAGFPAATMLGGLVYNSIGPKIIFILAFLGHLLGILLTIFAGGFAGLLISTFFVGFANGSVEAAANPMIARMYSNNKTTMLNRFHVWFPGGIAIGVLISYFLKKINAGMDVNIGWQAELSVILIPTLIYGYMVFTTVFPNVREDNTDETDTLKNIKALFSPLFIFMCILMTLTATSELGTQQWAEKLVGASSGANPLLVVALITGIMAVGRYFAGALVHALNPIGVLLMSAIVTTLGIFVLSIAGGAVVYIGAIIFALGVCYFWPTMVGFVGEYLPKTGALGMSVIGGIGMMGLAMWQPVIGGWIDSETAKAEAAGLAGEAVQLAAGQATLTKIMLFPIILIVAFGILFVLRKSIMKGSDNG